MFKRELPLTLQCRVSSVYRLGGRRVFIGVNEKAGLDRHTTSRERSKHALTVWQGGGAIAEQGGGVRDSASHGASSRQVLLFIGHSVPLGGCLAQQGCVYAKLANGITK